MNRDQLPQAGVQGQRKGGPVTIILLEISCWGIPSVGGGPVEVLEEDSSLVRKTDHVASETINL